MKKRIRLNLISVFVSLALILAGCGDASSNTEQPETNNDKAGDESFAEGDGSGSGAVNVSDEGTTIRLVNNKLEIVAGLNELAAKYEEESGVKVDIETIGGGEDTYAVLRNYLSKKTMPDIFVFEGDTQYDRFKKVLVDLSDEDWTKDTEAEYTVNGKVYGFPTTIEAIGLTYNKDILDKAGIDPASITGPESMREAFEKLDAQKKELGLKAVIGYYTDASYLWWSSGQHLFGTYLDSGLERDDTTYIDMINDGGQLDPERIQAFAEMIALFNEYTDPDGISGSYDDQIAGFASGKYAFVTQGSWIGAVLTGEDAGLYADAGNFEIGMIPYAFIEGQDTIQTSCPAWWGVYKDGNVEASKEFLRWCEADNAAQEILTKRCDLIAPFDTCSYLPDDPFADTIAKYAAEGKTSDWHWQKWKDGLAQNATCVVFRDFAEGKITTSEEFANKLSEAVEAYYAR